MNVRLLTLCAAIATSLLRLTGLRVIVSVVLLFAVLLSVSGTPYVLGQSERTSIGATQGQESGSATTRTYVDSAYGFSLEIPSVWTVNPASKERLGSVTQFISDSKSSTGNTPKMEIGVFTNDKPEGVTLEDWALPEPSSMPNLKQQQHVSLAGRDALRQDFTSAAGSGSIFFIPAVPKVYFIAVMPSGFLTSAQVQKALATFKIIAPPQRKQEEVPFLYRKQPSLPAVPTAGPSSKAPNAPSGYRLPFVGFSIITTGPGCYHTHTGLSSEAIDFAMNIGTRIYATRAGSIVYALYGYNGGFGNLMKIQHNDGNVSWYAHLDSFAKTSGSVAYEEHVANSGNTGESTGPHLHFEVRNSSNQSIWIRDLSGIRWYSNDPNNPCQAPGNPDGEATGPSLGQPPPQCSYNADQVVFYTDINYGGQCVTRNVGEYSNSSSIGLPNDSISSLKIGSNVRAVLCRDNDYSGGCETFTGDDSDLRGNSIGNDSVSSAKVERRIPDIAHNVEFWTDAGYSGNLCYAENAGNYNLSVCDEATSSLRMRSGWSVRVYKDPNISGPSRCFTGDDDNLTNNTFEDGSGMNDQISSVSIYNQSSCPPIIERPQPPELQGPSDGSQIQEGQSITLSWSATGSEYYGEIWGGPGGTLTFGWQGETSKNIGSQWPGYTYSWHVKARNSAGESGWSSTRTFTVRPAAPSGLSSHVVSCSRIDLSWTGNSENIDGYKIYRNGSYLDQVGSGVTTYQSAGLSENTTYSFYVKAFKGSIESDPSNTVSPSTGPCPTAIVPTNTHTSIPTNTSTSTPTLTDTPASTSTPALTGTPLSTSTPTASPTASSTTNTFTFQLDDGTREHMVAPPEGYAAIWLNRFTPQTSMYPITLRSIAILWPAQQSGTLSGLQARLLVYHDADGNGDPSNATLVSQSLVTMNAVEEFETYSVNITVSGKGGDIYIGFEDYWAEKSPTDFMPGAIDTNDSHRRSWLISNGGPPLDIYNLGNNEFRDLIDDWPGGLSGNWMIRASTDPPATATATEIASETPTRTLTSTATYTPMKTSTAMATATSSPTATYDSTTTSTPTSTPILSTTATNTTTTASSPTAVVSVTGVPTSTATHTATRTATATTSPQPPVEACVGTWRLTQRVNPGGGKSAFSGVDSAGANEVWAVGDYESYPDRSNVLIERWDGTRWNTSEAPIIPGAHSSSLSDVAVLSSNSVWAVGWARDASRTWTLIMHWDGRQWRIVPSPNNTSRNELNAITAISPDDVWAVGTYYTENGASRALTLHWNGQTWDFIPTYLGDGKSLSSVSGNASNNVWAVGCCADSVSEEDQYPGLILRWNGTSWTQMAAPLTRGAEGLTAVAALSPTDVWITGRYYFYDPEEETAYSGAYIRRWDGVSWPLSESRYAPNAMLDSISASSTNDVWFAGNKVLHYNDGSWSNLSNGPDDISLYLNDISAEGPGRLWGVGAQYYQDELGPPNRAMAEFYSSPQFADAPYGSPYYEYTRCMACKSIISGYPCGGAGEPCNSTHDPYFRPGVNVTRGQISKMVALAAGLTDAAGTQQFEDVWPDSTFYLWIQQLSNRGYISGYSCGGPGEPCYRPYNRPYFRPSANTTRGQLTKIVSNAAEFTDEPSGQSFADVPTTAPFYVWVERLYSRAVVSGYPCGGTNPATGQPEDCDGANRPYFRVNNNVTRGQTAKIVSETFFPNCHVPARR